MSKNRETSQFRAWLPDLQSDRFSSMRGQDCYTYAISFKENKNPPWLYTLYEHWLKLLSEPYKGITADGRVRHDLFTLEDDDLPIDDIVKATKFALSQANERHQQNLFFHIDSPEWRTWSNPEFLLSNKGIRLDDEDVTVELRDSILRILMITLSPEGFKKARDTMRINAFLGQLVDAPRIMNEFSYNFVLFGAEPSATRPWGFSFYGHHLCLNAFFYRRQMVLSPWFTGAEPNTIDSGPYQGIRILHKEETLGLRLMQSLSSELQSQAQVYRLMQDPAMPPGRWNRDDQRHLCGAYQDNRVVPYEGILVSDLSTKQQDIITEIFKEFLLYLPKKAQTRALDKIKAFYIETYFCWIGGYGDQDPFYYRIQSPVILIEFDHHSGVFLTNKEPARFHIHTLLRTPNAGDYGMALRPLIPSINEVFEYGI